VIGRLALVVALLAATPAGADELYSASAIVTGRDNLAERARGTREALLVVLARVAADPGVAAQALPEDPERYVLERRYTDRKAGVQISDEQGTRERSFILEVAFDPARIDALVRSLGKEPWKGERPALLVRLRVTDAMATYEVTRDSQRGWGQREAILAAGAKAGLPVVLPPGRAARVLSGEMRMTPEGYWRTEWQLGEQRWTLPPATFDRAIDNGIWTAASHLRITSRTAGGAGGR
jgi:hypothetical protein